MERQQQYDQQTRWNNFPTWAMDNRHCVIVRLEQFLFEPPLFAWPHILQNLIKYLYRANL